MSALKTLASPCNTKICGVDEFPCMSKKDFKLVWSDDPKDQDRLQSENEKAKPIEASDETINSLQWVAVFRIEKGGRGGKTVTVIDQLPQQQKFLSELCKELKNRCGAGGTFVMSGSHGLIEIQGDKREAIKAIFVKKGYKFKGM